MQNSTEILGVGVTASSQDKILKYVIDVLSKSLVKKEKIVIFTPNPEQISAANLDSSLKSLLNEADIALPDGIGVVLAAKLLGKPIEAKISGVDFMVKLLEEVYKVPSSSIDRPIKTGYFGGQKGVATEAAKCLKKLVPKMTIGYASDLYDKEKMIASDIDILFVGLGFPKQEKWIIEHKDEIPASIIMAVGGSFDFLSGRVPRAPIFLRTIGLEWLFRLAVQPWRIFRQARLLHFSALVGAEALSNRFKSPRTKN